MFLKCVCAAFCWPCSLKYGTASKDILQNAFRTHARSVLLLVGLAVLALLVWVMRKVFDRRRGILLPIEDTVAGEQTRPHIVEE